MREEKKAPQRQRILYLEDEVLIAFDIAAFLEDLNVAEVTVTHKLKDAWAVAESASIDLALLDINVDRRQTSFEIGKHLHDRGCVVIYASGNGSDAQRLRDAGYHFIDKPFNHTALEALILDALASKANADQ